jgi:hypothetical protein
MLSCRSKKLNYAELCEGDSDEHAHDGEDVHSGMSGHSDKPSIWGAREAKRPKSAPSRGGRHFSSTESDRQAKLKEALVLQMEMQKRLHDQLEVSYLVNLWNSPGMGVNGSGVGN